MKGREKKGNWGKNCGKKCNGEEKGRKGEGKLRKEELRSKDEKGREIKWKEEKSRSGKCKIDTAESENRSAVDQGRGRITNRKD